tara:strand:+ start:2349 stop:3338 length:990 start_codon:yes stop_codon:yes gene_type:complete
MALSKVTFPGNAGSIVDNTRAAKFIPDLWSDEIVAAYKKNLVLANLVSKMSMVGKKGDTLHIPKPTRGSATAKAANTAVTIQADTEAEVLITINKHFEYSRMIEDITDVQALDSMRRFYTEDAGYALALQLDTDLYNLGTFFGDPAGDGGDPDTPANWVNSNAYYVNASSGIAVFAENTVAPTDVFTDRAFRELIKLMDDADVPMDGRFFVIPPSVRHTILGIDRYVSSEFTNQQGVQNGKIGNLYGVDIYVSSNVPIIETAAENSAETTVTRGAILAHKDTMVLAEQVGVRTQTQYKQEYLADLMTADTLYGVSVLRPETGFVLAIPT